MAPQDAGRLPVAADILFEAGAWPDEARLRDLTVAAIGAAVSAAQPRLTANVEVSLVFTDDAHMRAMNRRYRGKDGATNVLSFPAARTDPQRFGPLLGDIVLAEETISAEAAAAQLAVGAHLTHLIVHGFLHLLGYDHESDDQAAVMEGLETAILAALGIADPYTEAIAGNDTRQQRMARQASET